MQTLDDPAISTTGKPDVEHLVCPCSKTITLCGAEDSSPYIDDSDWSEEEICILCFRLNAYPCPRCGEM